MYSKVSNKLSTVNVKKIVDILFFIYLICLFTFSENQSTIGIFYASTIAFIVSFIILCLTTRKINILFITNIKVYIVMIVYVLITIFFEDYLSYTIQRIITMVQIVIINVVIVNYIKTIKDIKRTMKYCIYASVFSGIYRLIDGGYAQIFSNRSSNEILIVGANNLATIMAIVFLMAIYFAVNQADSKLIWWVYAAFIGSIGLFTGSRKAVLAMGVGIIVFIILSGKRNLLKKLLLLMIISVLGWIIFMKVPAFSLAKERFLMMFGLFSNSNVDDSTLIRKEMIEIGMEAFYKNPIFGYGVGFIGGELVPSHFGYSTYLHNNYVELLVGLGLIGACLYYCVHTIIIAKLIKIRGSHSFRNLFLSIIISLLIIDIGAVSYYDKFTQFILTLCCISAQKRILLSDEEE